MTNDEKVCICGNTDFWKTSAWGRSYCADCGVIHKAERPRETYEGYTE